MRTSVFVENHAQCADRTRNTASRDLPTSGAARKMTAPRNSVDKRACGRLVSTPQARIGGRPNAIATHRRGIHEAVLGYAVTNESYLDDAHGDLVVRAGA
ncbi:hypothetical protein MRX96_038881 [Rhipicephalus microplus]